LVVSVTVCVFGVATGGLAPWLITSAALSLASWDLILLDIALAGSPSAPQTERLEKAHYRSLGLALGAGLLLGLGGRLIHFHIPFIFMLVLIVLAYFSLDRLLRALGHPFHL
jgi:DMSO/TMAO reductase YedYZ heme-binding membrane subunit